VELRSIFELGVDEAYAMLRDRFEVADLPPLEAIEYEDWGRDYLLSRFLQVPAAALAKAGILLASQPPHGRTTPVAETSGASESN
jgi:hypothetical protein